MPFRSAVTEPKTLSLFGYPRGKIVLFMKARAHVIIDGRVQGVFFRAFTRDVARTLGLNGWVRNLYDGRVEAVFEGERETIEKAIQECYQGPPYARVSDIDITWEDRLEGLKDFAIRY